MTRSEITTILQDEKIRFLLLWGYKGLFDSDALFHNPGLGRAGVMQGDAICSWQGADLYLVENISRKCQMLQK
jgi:hypothetical protein